MNAQARALFATVQNYQRGNTYLWRACFAASVAVGNYEPGRTRTLADALHRSVDTVENMARAARCYLALAREFRGVSEMLCALRLARRELYYSHFSELEKLRAGYNLTSLETFAQITTAAGEHASTRAMSAQITESEMAQYPNGHLKLRLREIRAELKRMRREAPQAMREYLTAACDALTDAEQVTA